MRTWSLRSKLPSLLKRLNRLNSSKLVPWRWYSPLAKGLMQIFAGQDLRLIIDCTKVGFKHRLLSVSIAYKKRYPLSGAFTKALGILQ